MAAFELDDGDVTSELDAGQSGGRASLALARPIRGSRGNGAPSTKAYALRREEPQAGADQAVEPRGNPRRLTAVSTANSAICDYVFVVPPCRGTRDQLPPQVRGVGRRGRVGGEAIPSASPPTTSAQPAREVAVARASRGGRSSRGPGPLRERCVPTPAE